MTKTFSTPEIINKKLIEIIKNTKIDHYYIKNNEDFRNEILNSIDKNDLVLDVGKGMREKFDLINSNKIETLDINKFENYPDILFDLCDELDESLIEKYDKIICLAILEHVYNPFLAIANLRKMLKNNGIIFGYVPFLYHYHAPNSLKFQDYFRFSKDALAILFRDFSNVRLYPLRGRISTQLNLLFPGRWKKYFEKLGINKYLDILCSDEKNFKQCSGFNFIIRK